MKTLFVVYAVHHDMNYGMSIENVNAINTKAKLKKDGCYTFRGVSYRVKNNVVTHYACNGEIVERCFGFHVVIGKYDGYSEAGRKTLQTL